MTPKSELLKDDVLTDDSARHDPEEMYDEPEIDANEDEDEDADEDAEEEDEEDDDDLDGSVGVPEPA